MKWVFDEFSLLCVLIRFLPDYFVKTIEEELGTPEHRAADAVKTMLSALLPGQARSTCKDKIPKIHSSFRCQVVINAILNAQKNRFDKFIKVPEKISPNHNRSRSIGEVEKSSASAELNHRESMSGRTASYSSKESRSAEQKNNSGASGKIEHLKWLRPRFMTIEDIDAAQRRHEMTINFKNGESSHRDGPESREGGSSEVWYEIKDVPNRADVSKYGARRVFSIVKNFCERVVR